MRGKSLSEVYAQIEQQRQQRLLEQQAQQMRAQELAEKQRREYLNWVRMYESSSAVASSSAAGAGGSGQRFTLPQDDVVDPPITTNIETMFYSYYDNETSTNKYFVYDFSNSVKYDSYDVSVDPENSGESIYNIYPLQMGGFYYDTSVNYKVFTDISGQKIWAKQIENKYVDYVGLRFIMFGYSEVVEEVVVYSVVFYDGNSVREYQFSNEVYLCDTNYGESSLGIYFKELLPSNEDETPKFRLHYLKFGVSDSYITIGDFYTSGDLYQSMTLSVVALYRSDNFSNIIGFDIYEDGILVKSYDLSSYTAALQDTYMTFGNNILSVMSDSTNAKFLVLYYNNTYRDIYLKEVDNSIGYGYTILATKEEIFWEYNDNYQDISIVFNDYSSNYSSGFIYANYCMVLNIYSDLDHIDDLYQFCTPDDLGQKGIYVSKNKRNNGGALFIIADPTVSNNYQTMKFTKGVVEPSFITTEIDYTYGVISASYNMNGWSAFFFINYSENMSVLYFIPSNSDTMNNVGTFSNNYNVSVSNEFFEVSDFVDGKSLCSSDGFSSYRINETANPDFRSKYLTDGYMPDGFSMLQIGHTLNSAGSSPSVSFYFGDPDYSLNEVYYWLGESYILSYQHQIKNGIFIFGDYGDDYINDGGSNMYDIGNYIYTGIADVSNSISVPYTHTQMFGFYPLIFYKDGQVTNGNSTFGTGSTYFTNLYEGLFVLSAYDTSVNSFYIDGGLGDDGGGYYGSLTFYINDSGDVVNDDWSHIVFCKYVGGTYPPSVNHMIIVKTTASIDDFVHDIGTTTDSDFDMLSGDGFNTVSRIHYMVMSREAGETLSNQDFYNIVKSYMILTNDSISTTLSNLNSNYTHITSNLPQHVDNGYSIGVMDYEGNVLSTVHSDNLGQFQVCKNRMMFTLNDGSTYVMNKKLPDGQKLEYIGNYNTLSIVFNDFVNWNSG